MPKKDKVIENLDWTTERLSNRVWSISVGVLATCLAYIVESTKTDADAFLEPEVIAVPACLAIISLLFDLLQYFAANRQSLSLLKEIETRGADEGLYDQDSLFARIRSFAYWAKISTCVVSAIWLVAVSTQRAFALI